MGLEPLVPKPPLNPNGWTYVFYLFVVLACVAFLAGFHPWEWFGTKSHASIDTSAETHSINSDMISVTSEKRNWIDPENNSDLWKLKENLILTDVGCRDKIESQLVVNNYKIFNKTTNSLDFKKDGGFGTALCDTENRILLAYYYGPDNYDIDNFQKDAKIVLQAALTDNVLNW